MPNVADQPAERILPQAGKGPDFVESSKPAFEREPEFTAEMAEKAKAEGDEAATHAHDAGAIHHDAGTIAAGHDAEANPAPEATPSPHEPGPVAVHSTEHSDTEKTTINKVDPPEAA